LSIASAALVAGKPLMLEDLFLDMGTSVASAHAAETIFEIMKCMFDVDMRGRGRIGSKNAHDRNILIFRSRASTVTGNTLINPNCASVRQSTDSLHRDTHKLTKKVAASPCSETA